MEKKRQKEQCRVRTNRDMFFWELRGCDSELLERHRMHQLKVVLVTKAGMAYGFGE